MIRSPDAWRATARNFRNKEDRVAARAAAKEEYGEKRTGTVELDDEPEELFTKREFCQARKDRGRACCTWHFLLRCFYWWGDSCGFWLSVLIVARTSFIYESFVVAHRALRAPPNEG